MLSRTEVARLLEQVEPTFAPMVALLYGAGLRLMECLYASRPQVAAAFGHGRNSLTNFPVFFTSVSVDKYRRVTALYSQSARMLLTRTTNEQRYE